MISRAEAWNLLIRHLKNDKMRKHCLAVEAVMKAIATKLGRDPELWGLVGLLHDVDYELVNRDPRRHGLEALNMLKGLLPEEAVEAIAAHNEHNGFKPSSGEAELIAKALRAADHVSGLIVATALVMPSKKLSEVKLSTLVKKFKSKDFARGINRDRIAECEKLGIKLEEFLELSLSAMKNIANSLGL